MGTATQRHNTAAGTAIPLQPRPDKVLPASSSCRAVAEAEVVEAVEEGEGWVGSRRDLEDPVCAPAVGTGHLM